MSSISFNSALDWCCSYSKKKEEMKMLKKMAIALLTFGFAFSLTGCTKYYVNTSKSPVTKVEPGSDQYMSRVMESVYSGGFGLNSKDLQKSMVNETLDGDTYWYYVYDNKDILRIAEDYTFVIYKNCEWWDLSYNLPVISSYDSATKYSITADNFWYFVYYTVDSGTPFEDYDEEPDDSMYDDYNMNWVLNGPVDPEHFLNVRLFHYNYLKFADSAIASGDDLPDYDWVKNVYSFNTVSNYDQDIELEPRSMFYFAYWHSGELFSEWVRGVYGSDTVDGWISALSEYENFEGAASAYLEPVSLDNNMFCLNVDNPSNWACDELDDILGLPKLTKSMDFNALSLYNNYNSNENIIYSTPDADGEAEGAPEEVQEGVLEDEEAGGVEGEDQADVGDADGDGGVQDGEEGDGAEGDAVLGAGEGGE